MVQLLAAGFLLIALPFAPLAERLTAQGELYRFWGKRDGLGGKPQGNRMNDSCSHRRFPISLH